MSLSYFRVATSLESAFQQLGLRWFAVAFLCGLIFLSRVHAEQSAGDEALFARLDRNKDQQITADEVDGQRHRLFERLLRRGDTDADGALSSEEFLAALVPSRPDKSLESKQPATSPQANAVRWLLLAMDTNADGWIELAEVPEDLEQTFDALAQRLDNDNNEVLDNGELIRGGRPLAQIASRYVRQNDINVDAELKRLQRQQGEAANRFEQRRGPLENLSDPLQAGQLFARLDANRDGQLEAREVPEPLRRPIQRLLRFADRDGDSQLSRQEFLSGARRMAARRARQSAAEVAEPDAMSNEAMPAER